MRYHYDEQRGRAYFSYRGKQSFADVPRSDGVRAAFAWLSYQARRKTPAFRHGDIRRSF